MEARITPLGNKILVIPDDPLKQTDSGIHFLVDPNSNDELGKGRVYSVGPLVTELKADDRVLFKKYLARPTDIEGELYLRFIDGDIEGIID